jgi:hypothetical protein
MHMVNVSNGLVNQVNLSGTIYYYFFVFAGLAAAGGVLFRHYIIKTIKEENEKLLQIIHEMDRRTSRIEYALYNDGKTGLINKVDALIDNQQVIKTDVEVMKARYYE